MNCPHCDREIPVNYSPAYCPFCGKDLAPDEQQPAHLESEPAGWGKFFMILFAPAIVCLVAGSLGLEGVMAFIGFFGAIVAGLMCTRIVMYYSDLSGLRRGAAHFFLALILCGLSFFLTAIGCTIGIGVSKS